MGWYMGSNGVDCYLISPALESGLLFILFWVFFYSSLIAFIFWGTLIILLLVFIIKGLIGIYQKHFKRAISYIAISILFLALLSPFVVNRIIPVRHHLQFLAGKQKYEAEIGKMNKLLPIYKKWLWSDSEQETSLVFDETDRTLKAQNLCKEQVYKVGIHFYVVVIDFGNC